MLSLKKRGRHVQIGLTTQKEKGNINLSVDFMIASEITFLGSLGMPSHRYNALLELVGSKKFFLKS